MRVGSLNLNTLINSEMSHTHTHTHLAAVVVEHCRDVLFGKRSSGVGDEEAGLPHSTVSHDNTLYTLHGEL